MSASQHPHEQSAQHDHADTSANAAPPKKPATGTIYTCPMHPENWIMQEVLNGATLPGLYPPNAANKARYEAANKAIKKTTKQG